MRKKACSLKAKMASLHRLGESLFPMQAASAPPPDIPSATIHLCVLFHHGIAQLTLALDAALHAASNARRSTTRRSTLRSMAKLHERERGLRVPAVRRSVPGRELPPRELRGARVESRVVRGACAQREAAQRPGLEGLQLCQRRGWQRRHVAREQIEVDDEPHAEASTMSTAVPMTMSQPPPEHRSSSSVAARHSPARWQEATGEVVGG